MDFDLSYFDEHNIYHLSSLSDEFSKSPPTYFLKTILRNEEMVFSLKDYGSVHDFYIAYMCMRILQFNIQNSIIVIVGESSGGRR